MITIIREEHHHNHRRRQQQRHHRMSERLICIAIVRISRPTFVTLCECRANSRFYCFRDFVDVFVLLLLELIVHYISTDYFLIRLFGHVNQ